MSLDDGSILLPFLKLKTTSEETIFSATTAVKQLVKANTNRLALIIANDSAQDIHISTRNNVSTSRGIRLTKSGGYAEYRTEDFYIFPQKEWFIVADANVTVTVIEILRVA